VSAPHLGLRHNFTVSPDFLDCVTRTTIALDDAVTSADVIATVVVARCRVELAASQAQSTEFTARLMPVLTASVIVHRRQVQQRQGPRPPLAPIPAVPASGPVLRPTT
jgi:hypothetical protein